MKPLFNANLWFLVAQSPAGAAASPVQAPGVVVVQAPSAQPAQATVQVVQAQEIPAGNAPFWYRLWPQHRSPLSSANAVLAPKLTSASGTSPARTPSVPTVERRTPQVAGFAVAAERSYRRESRCSCDKKQN